MPTIQYSRLVLLGLQKRGIRGRDLEAITGLPARDVQQVLNGKKRLRDRDLATIEHASGMSAGQLAFLATGGSDQKVQALLDSWADVRAGSPTASAK